MTNFKHKAIIINAKDESTSETFKFEYDLEKRKLMKERAERAKAQRKTLQTIKKMEEIRKLKTQDKYISIGNNKRLKIGDAQCYPKDDGNYYFMIPITTEIDSKEEEEKSITNVW